jgi:hypothetical protein
MKLTEKLSDALSWIPNPFKAAAERGRPVKPMDWAETPEPRRTQGYTTIYNSDMFLKIPPFPISYARMYEIAMLDPCTRACIYNLNLFSYMDGFQWVPKWTSKCPKCKTEYTGETPLDRCPECDPDPDDLFTLLGQIATSDESQEKLQANILETASPKTKMEYPNPKEYEKVDDFFKCCNNAGQSLENVMRSITIDWNTCDDAYVVMRKKYIIAPYKKLPATKKYPRGEIVSSRIIEILRGAPYLIRKVIDQNNRVGGRWYKCLLCEQLRGVSTIIENENWGADRFSVEGSTMVKVERKTNGPGWKPPKCPKCGAKTHDIIYFEMLTEAGNIQKYFIEGEILHRQKWSPSTAYGQPPVLTLLIIQEGLVYQNLYIRDWFGERKVPTGVLSVVTANLRSFMDFWKSELIKRKEDKQHIPIIPTEPEGTGFGGVGGVKWVPLFQTLAEMQYTDSRNEMRQRVEAMYGISADIKTGAGEKRELSEKERKVITNEQRLINLTLKEITKQFNIKDWCHEAVPSEEVGLLRKLMRDKEEIQNMQMVKNMGFEVDRDANDKWRFWKPVIDKEQEAQLQQLIQAKFQLEAQMKQQKEQEAMQSYNAGVGDPKTQPEKGKQDPYNRGVTKTQHIEKGDNCLLCEQLEVQDWEFIMKCYQTGIDIYSYEPDGNYDVAKSVVKRGGKYCVVHGSPQKEGSKTDKPKGTAIKCYDDPKKAHAMHYAIRMSKKRRGELKKEQPPDAWMERCMASVSGKADEPGALCNWVWNNWRGRAVSKAFGEGRIGKATSEAEPTQMRTQGRIKTDIDQKPKSGSTYTPGAAEGSICPECGQRFENKQALGGHMQTAHKGGQTPGDPAMEAPDMEAQLDKINALITALLTSIAASHRPTNTIQTRY